MYNQFQNNAFQGSFGSTGFVGSQYRGNTAKYQPVGFVQSQYGGAASNAFGSQFQPSQQQQWQQTNPQAYHTANYRGNQQGHDQYLRADSVQPAQSQFGIGASSFNQGISSFGSSIGSQWGAGQSSYSSYQTNPQAYHTANYRGNQQGHDQYLRADSVQPAQSQYGIGASSSFSQFPSSSFQNQSQFGASSFGRQF
ncbi:hypothetical protein [Paenibacillus hamazuiensis]|uniref:hypothetical protein n=1 Tax=Paenibacillus hamazuiensis TaxID=2936508 RepID=UPI00200D1CCA|nr:hypothetical protein [Paenibacillus hamazuiensis]